MAHDSNDEIQGLKEKFNSLEQKLLTLHSSLQNNLEMAKKLQKLFFPNRLADVKGINSYLRFIPGYSLSSESFEYIPTKNNRELWFISSWTESFGLSSVLLQAMSHVHALAEIESKLDLTVQEFRQSIISQFKEYNSKLNYKIGIIKIDLHTLKIDYIYDGLPPIFKREKGLHWEKIDYLVDVPESFEKKLMTQSNCDFDTPVFEGTTMIKPGSRLLYLNSSWHKHQSCQSFLDFTHSLKYQGHDLIDDINSLMLGAQKSKEKEETDLLCIGFEIDEKKIHLA